MKGRWKYGTVLFVLLQSACRIGSSTSTHPQSDPADLIQEAAPELEASKLADEYRANEIAADGRYKGNRYRITGLVRTIGRDGDDGYILFEGSRRGPGIRATFGPKHVSSLGNMGAARYAEATCTVAGYRVYVEATNCRKGR